MKGQVGLEAFVGPCCFWMWWSEVFYIAMFTLARLSVASVLDVVQAQMRKNIYVGKHPDPLKIKSQNIDMPLKDKTSLALWLDILMK